MSFPCVTVASDTCVTWTPGLEEETGRKLALFLFSPVSGAVEGEGSVPPKMSTGYHKGTALCRHKRTWSVTCALGTKFIVTGGASGDTEKGHYEEDRQKPLMFRFSTCFTERQLSQHGQLETCCHPGCSAVFLGMYRCFSIHHPPSYSIPFLSVLREVGASLHLPSLGEKSIGWLLSSMLLLRM